MRRGNEILEVGWALVLGMGFLYFCFTAINPSSIGEAMWRPGTILSNGAADLALEWDIVRWKTRLWRQGMMAGHEERRPRSQPVRHARHARQTRAQADASLDSPGAGTMAASRRRTDRGGRSFDSADGKRPAGRRAS